MDRPPAPSACDVLPWPSSCIANQLHVAKGWSFGETAHFEDYCGTANITPDSYYRQEPAVYSAEECAIWCADEFGQNEGPDCQFWTLDDFSNSCQLYSEVPGPGSVAIKGGKKVPMVRPCVPTVKIPSACDVLPWSLTCTATQLHVAKGYTMGETIAYFEEFCSSTSEETMQTSFAVASASSRGECASMCADYDGRNFWQDCQFWTYDSFGTCSMYLGELKPGNLPMIGARKIPVVKPCVPAVTPLSACDASSMLPATCVVDHLHLAVGHGTNSHSAYYQEICTAGFDPDKYLGDGRIRGTIEDCADTCASWEGLSCDWWTYHVQGSICRLFSGAPTAGSDVVRGVVKVTAPVSPCVHSIASSSSSVIFSSIASSSSSSAIASVSAAPSASAIPKVLRTCDALPTLYETCLPDQLYVVQAYEDPLSSTYFLELCNTKVDAASRFLSASSGSPQDCAEECVLFDGLFGDTLCQWWTWDVTNDLCSLHTETGVSGTGTLRGGKRVTDNDVVPCVSSASSSAVPTSSIVPSSSISVSSLAPSASAITTALSSCDASPDLAPTCTANQFYVVTAAFAHPSRLAYFLDVCNTNVDTASQFSTQDIFDPHECAAVCAFYDGVSTSASCTWWIWDDLNARCVLHEGGAPQAGTGTFRGGARVTNTVVPCVSSSSSSSSFAVPTSSAATASSSATTSAVAISSSSAIPRPSVGPKPLDACDASRVWSADCIADDLHVTIGFFFPQVSAYYKNICGAKFDEVTYIGFWVVGTAQQCAAHCTDTATCRGWKWQPGSTDCYLYSSVGVAGTTVYRGGARVMEVLAPCSPAVSSSSSSMIPSPSAVSSSSAITSAPSSSSFLSITSSGISSAPSSASSPQSSPSLSSFTVSISGSSSITSVISAFSGSASLSQSSVASSSPSSSAMTISGFSSVTSIATVFSSPASLPQSSVVSSSSSSTIAISGSSSATSIASVFSSSATLPRSSELSSSPGSVIASSSASVVPTSSLAASHATSSSSLSLPLSSSSIILGASPTIASASSAVASNPHPGIPTTTAPHYGSPTSFLSEVISASHAAYENGQSNLPSSSARHYDSGLSYAADSEPSAKAYGHVKNTCRRKRQARRAV